MKEALLEFKYEMKGPIAKNIFLILFNTFSLLILRVTIVLPDRCVVGSKLVETSRSSMR